MPRFVSSRYRGDVQECAERIVEEAHVWTIPGHAFGRSGEGYLRPAVTVDEATIDQAFDRLARMPMFQAGVQRS